MFCCICEGTCNHTGPHTYCERHNPGSPAPYTPVSYPMWPLHPMPPPPGWLCPACGRGNAPWASQCPCKPPAFNTDKTAKAEEAT